jgi:hypothetical protein
MSRNAHATKGFAEELAQALFLAQEPFYSSGRA